MHNKLLHITKYAIAGFIGLLLFSGCTATSAPAPSNMQCQKDFKVNSNDKITVAVSSSPDVVITEDAKKRISQKVKAEVDALKSQNTVMCEACEYQLNVHVTKYDKGSAFARMMLAGLGQIHIDADTNILKLPKKTKVATFNLDKTFAWGGIYGGTTTIEDVEDGFAKGVAEAVTKTNTETKQ